MEGVQGTDHLPGEEEEDEAKAPRIELYPRVPAWQSGTDVVLTSFYDIFL